MQFKMIFCVHQTISVALIRTTNPLIGGVSLVLGRWRNHTHQKSTVIGVLEVEMAEKMAFSIFQNDACYPSDSKSARKDENFDTR